MRTLDELGISPAPWEAEVFADGHYAYITARSVNGNKKIVGSEHSTADARLIAAAPNCLMSLAETLDALKNRLPSTPTLDELEIINRAEAAIRKATGESEVRVWCKHDPTRKCVDCEICPDESEVRDE